MKYSDSSPTCNNETQTSRSTYIYQSLYFVGAKNVDEFDDVGGMFRLQFF